MGRGRDDLGHPRRRPHDRASSPWLIRRFLDPAPAFVFVAGPDVPAGAVPFDMRGVEFGHQGQDCTSETLLRRHDLIDRVLWRIAAIIHQADLEDDRYDAPEAPGLDVVLRGLSMVRDDHTTLELTGPMFDGRGSRSAATGAITPTQYSTSTGLG